MNLAEQILAVHTALLHGSAPDRHGTTPMNLLHPLLVFLASLTQQELARQVVFLREENRILRSRLPSRVIATPAEKSRLIKLGRELGVKLRELISIVSYSTFRRWIREAETSHMNRQQSASTTTLCIG